jgi:predicted metal-dependent peptidase
MTSTFTAQQAESMVSAFILRLRMRSPFFATLAMFARFYPTDALPTLATNGREIFFNPGFLSTLPLKQLDACLLHHVLHAAFVHPLNHSVRNATLWNIAADILVNGVLAAHPFLELLPGAIRNKDLEKKPIEEIYEILLKKGDPTQLKCSCFVSAEGLTEEPLPLLTPTQKIERQAYWNQATRQAEVVQRSCSGGQALTSLEVIFAYLAEQRADWRVSLWRFLIKTPADFSGFDRRMIGRELYLDDTHIEPVAIYACIDLDSGVDTEQRATFLQELAGILSAYPHLSAQVFYLSNGLSGPHEPEPGELLARLQERRQTGSFWSYVRRETEQSHIRGLCVYVTDGFGDDPAQPPDLPVLWLVTPGGRELDQFPFGQAVRLLRFI